MANFNEQEYQQYLTQRQQIINEFTQTKAYDLIKQRLNNLITTEVREYNFVLFMENQDLISYLINNPLPYLTVANNFYLYTQPSQVSNLDEAVQQLQILFDQHGIAITEQRIRSLLSPQQNRYVRVMDGVSSIIATNLINLKREYQQNPQYSGRTTSLTGE